MDLREMFSSTIEAVSEAIENIKEKAEEFFEENKKMALILCGLIFFIFVCLILLVFIAATGNDKKTKDKKSVSTEQMVTGTVEPVVPDGPKLPKDYNITRQQKDKWSKEEGEEWFTIPGTSEIDSLSSANEKIVNEIIGAAP